MTMRRFRDMIRRGFEWWPSRKPAWTELERRTAIDVILGTPGVMDAGDLRVSTTGRQTTVVAAIHVHPRMTVWEGHDIAKAVKMRLYRRFSNLAEVHIQVLPYDPVYPYYIDGFKEESDAPSVLH